MNEYVRKKIVTVPLVRFSGTHKIHSLASSRCPAFFSADVILNGNTVHLCYSTAGYRPLHCWRNIEAVKILETVKQVLQSIQTARDWMWSPEDYLLTTDTVWVNDKQHVKFICIPDDRPASEARRLQGFLQSLEKSAEPAAAPFLKILQDMAAADCIRTEQFLSEIDQMIAEVRSYL